MMEIVLDNEVIVTEPNKRIIEFIKNNLIFDNPEYIKKVKRNLWVGLTPQKIEVFYQVGNSLHLPFGVWKDIYILCTEEERKFVTLKIKKIERKPIKSSVKLYDYQEEAVKKIIKTRNGLVVAGAGSGKTMIALETVARIGGSMLWLTHTKDLLEQAKCRFLANYDVDLKDIGTVSEGKVNIQRYTFATVQTMCKKNLESFKHCFDIIIVDEFHNVKKINNFTLFDKVISNLSAMYKIGITATDYRNDGNFRAALTLIGDKMCEIPRSEIEKNLSPLKIKRIEIPFEIETKIFLNSDGTINYHEIIKNLVKNEKRNNKIVETLKKIDKPTIVLSERIAHLLELQKMLGEGVVITSETSKKMKEVRKKVFENLNNGTIKVVFATYKLLKEGVDIPKLEYIIFASPIKDPIAVEQASGRVMRKAEGKEYGTVIDIVDNFGLFKGFEKARVKVYKKIGGKYIE